MLFAAGVVEVAENAVATAKRLADLIQRDRDLVRGVGRGAPTALQAHGALQREPFATIPRMVARTRLSVPGASAALERLIALDLVKELTGRQLGWLAAMSERSVHASRMAGCQGRFSNLGDGERRLTGTPGRPHHTLVEAATRRRLMRPARAFTLRGCRRPWPRSRPGRPPARSA
jgi:hypothetical protein